MMSVYRIHAERNQEQSVSKVHISGPATVTMRFRHAWQLRGLPSRDANVAVSTHARNPHTRTTRGPRR
jgi:hypothetical protein